MGIELQDFRGRITPETHCVLEAQSRTTGRDRQEILRDVMHAWAMEQIHIASVMDHLLRAEGLRGIDGGIRGSVREDEGAQGKAREGKGST
jgi:hypothetical protein